MYCYKKKIYIYRDTEICGCLGGPDVPHPCSHTHGGELSKMSLRWRRRTEVQVVVGMSDRARQKRDGRPVVVFTRMSCSPALPDTSPSAISQARSVTLLYTVLQSCRLFAPVLLTRTSNTTREVVVHYDQKRIYVSIKCQGMYPDNHLSVCSCTNLPCRSSSSPS